jgi:hypothetical protein
MSASEEDIGQMLANNPMVMQAPQPTMEMPKLEENKSLWKSFIDKVQGDPNLRMALMSMGAGMLRSPGFGQNAGDVIGSSVAQGISTFAQGRQQDKQNAMAEQEQQRKQKETDTGAAVAQQNAGTYSTAVGAQVKATDANIKQGEAQTAVAQTKAALEAELAPREVAVKERNAGAAETSAQADLIRSKAYAQNAPTAGKGTTGQNVQLVNQRKQALMAMNPGMTEEEATLTAQNDILLSKQNGGNPAAIARGLFDSQLKAWMGNFENLGKNPPPEVLNQIKQSSIDMAKEMAKLNGRGTPTTATSGTIDRTGGASLQQEPTQGSVIDQAMEKIEGRKVRGVGGQIAEIIASDGTNVSLRLPDGRTITQPLEVVSPHIIAE